jgi:hypothetical protein
MKRIAFVIVCIVLSSPVFSQQRRMSYEGDPDGEIIAGTGFSSWQQMNMSLGDGFAPPIADSISGGDTDPKIETSSKGTFFIGFQGFLTEQWTAGLHLLYGKYVQTNNYANKNQVVFTNTYIGGYARTEFIWMNTEMVQFYSSASLGVMNVASKETFGAEANKIEPIFQLSPIGMRVGSNIGVHIEAGLGSYGIVSAGIRYRFN